MSHDRPADRGGRRRRAAPSSSLATASPRASRQRARSSRRPQARSTLAALVPQPLPPTGWPRPMRSRPRSARRRLKDASVVWLTDGIDHDKQTRATLPSGWQKLASGGTLAVIDQQAGSEPLGIVGGLGRERQARSARPAHRRPARAASLHAILRPRRSASAKRRYASRRAKPRTTAPFDLPLELRNQVTRIELAGERSAGAVNLLDARSQWHRSACFRAKTASRHSRCWRRSTTSRRR